MGRYRSVDRKHQAVDQSTAWSELLLAAKGQSEAAIAEIYRRYQPNVLRYLRVCDVNAAEDIASSVWMDAARSLRGFEGDDHAFLSWLFTIVRRRLIDHQRREIRTVASPPEAALSPPSDAAMLARQDAANVAATVRRFLPAIQAEVVLLRSVAGLTVAEVAQVLEKSETAVRILQHRGLRKLAQMHSPESFSEEVKHFDDAPRSS